MGPPVEDHYFEKKRVQPMEAIEDVPQAPAVVEPKRRMEGGEGSHPGNDKPGSDGPPPSGGQGSSGSSSKTSSSSSKMEADDESDKSEDEDPGETRVLQRKDKETLLRNWFLDQKM